MAVDSSASTPGPSASGSGSGDPTVIDSGVATTTPDVTVPDPSEGAAGATSDASIDASNNRTDASLTTGPFPFRPPFILGADITWTLEDEASGATHSDGVSVKPLEEIMANNGFNYIRLRTFVNPSAAGGYSRQGFGDTAHTITMAKRVKRCGMGLFLDFHMSDTWASIGAQIMPSAWTGMTPTQMQTAAHDYVKGVLDQMVAAGVEPDMVQVGNETNSSMSGVPMSNWADFSGLVNAGIRAVRETDPRIIVWAQHGRPRPDGNFEPWVDKYLSGTPAPKIDEDGICGSTYGTTANGTDWQQQFQYVIRKYNKPVMSCEYTDLAPDAPGGALINGVMHGFANGMGYGSFIWEPTRYPSVNGAGTLFSKTGNTYTTNAAMADYPKLAKSYGLPVPASVCH
ncbi:MAG: arabinogalactan endo-1,4-beta-galactosidase [Myxococcota bacterium]|nr:arabinogalactan endo-1,4-beta-galactosidase [Myxococcota bacterium]